MTENTIYRKALEKAIPDIVIKDGSVLVTGASGLIGSCLIDLLMIANEKGRKFDVYAMGRNIEKLEVRFSKFADKIHFVEHDIRKTLSDDYFFDYIIHGASNADPKSYAVYPVETMLTNMKGTENILEYCKKHLKTKVIFLSTFEIYGNLREDLYEESDYGIVDLNLTRSCYPESKRCAEMLVRSYVDEYDVNAVIGRLCSIYGPTMANEDSKAHAQFIKNAIKGEEIVLKSKGKQRRTYCYVMDAVTGIFYVLEKGAVGEAYNISYENSIASIAEVAQIVAEIADKQVVFNLPDAIEQKGFSKPQDCILVNSKLKALGWRGYYSLNKGMTETIKIMKEQYLCVQ